MSEESVRGAGERGGDVEGARDVPESAPRGGGGAHAGEAGGAARASGPAPENPRLRLRRLKINAWQNVWPGTELRFGDGVHALLGKNGTGKTTLLKLVSMCVRGNFEELGQQVFDFEYELIAGDARVDVHVGQEKASGFEGAPQELFKQELRVSLLRAGAEPVTVTVRGGAVVVDTGTGEPEPFEISLSPYRPFLALTVPLLRRERGAQSVPPLWLVSLSEGLHSASGAYRFDEMLGILRCIEGLPAEDASAPPGLVIHAMLGERMPMLINHPLMPAELGGRILRTASPEDTRLRLGAADLPFLRTYAEKCGFKSVEMALSRSEKRQSEGGGTALTYEKASFSIKLNEVDEIEHDKLSYGQKRLLSLLYYTACNPSIVIADELTNGLHHEWIAACVEELEKRQSFIATQNPLLLDYLPIRSAEDAASSFIQCRVVKRDGREWMEWQNTSREKAEWFWQSYQAGVQYISEILRTEGLW